MKLLTTAARDWSNEPSAARRSPQGKFSMSGRILIRAIELFIASLCALASPASAGDYRGAAAGWPAYANGTYAANYPANYAAAPYYVARPVATTASAGYAPTGMMYAPTEPGLGGQIDFGLIERKTEAVLR